MSRRKCSVCGLYVGAKPHTGAIHDRILGNRAKLRKGLALRPAKLRRRKR
jgi:hypothetical protein